MYVVIQKSKNLKKFNDENFLKYNLFPKMLSYNDLKLC